MLPRVGNFKLEGVHKLHDRTFGVERDRLCALRAVAHDRRAVFVGVAHGLLVCHALLDALQIGRPHCDCRYHGVRELLGLPHLVKRPLVHILFICDKKVYALLARQIVAFHCEVCLSQLPGHHVLYGCRRVPDALFRDNDRQLRRLVEDRRNVSRDLRRAEPAREPVPEIQHLPSEICLCGSVSHGLLPSENICVVVQPHDKVRVSAFVFCVLV